MASLLIRFGRYRYDMSMYRRTTYEDKTHIMASQAACYRTVLSDCAFPCNAVTTKFRPHSRQGSRHLT
ncbi:hypothetical protein M3J09_007990 [Ascochyta lentis]